MVVNDIQQYLQDHCRLMERLAREMTPQIAAAADLLHQTLAQGGKVLIMGNGGSAADAQHFAAELVGRFQLSRAALPALALTTDSSLLTSVANDFGFEQVFARQVEGLAVSGDLVVGISTSGNSENVFLGLQRAKEQGCRTLALLGRDGGRCAGLTDTELLVPGEVTAQVQEAHITLIHLCCRLVEQRLVAE